MSHLICTWPYAKTKTQISFAVTAKLFSAFVFTTPIVRSLFYLNPKLQASSHLLCLYSPVCVGPRRKPRRPVFLRRSSFYNDHQIPILSHLFYCRYNDIRVKELPLETYADGKWYEKPAAERIASHPLIINNNWVLGNEKKKQRAIQWGHWFVKDDLTCDMTQVKKVVY